MSKSKIGLLLLFCVTHVNFFAGTIFSLETKNSNTTDAQNRSREIESKEKAVQEISRKILELADENSEELDGSTDELYKLMQTQWANREDITEEKFRENFYPSYYLYIGMIKGKFLSAEESKATAVETKTTQNKQLEQEATIEIFDVLQSIEIKEEMDSFPNIRLFYDVVKEDVMDEKLFQSWLSTTVRVCIPLVLRLSKLEKYYNLEK